MKKLIPLFILVFYFLLSSYTFAFAEDIQGTYSVSPVLSQHQTEGIDNFYDIRWTPSVTESFGLSITNNSNIEKTYEIQVNKAITNKNGIIDYSNISKDTSNAQYKLKELIQLPKQISVPANSSQEVKGTIAFPSESFNGILMAGIHVSEKSDQKQQASVSNTVAYNLPFVVRGNIDQRPTPKLMLSELNIEKLSSDKTSLNAHLNNEEANLLKASQLKAEIKDRNNKNVLTQTSKIDITPNTKFIYPIIFKETLKRGSYKLILTITHGQDKWEFNKIFNISAKDTALVEQQHPKQNHHWIWYMIATIITLIISSIILFKKKNKKRKLNINKLSRRNK